MLRKYLFYTPQEVDSMPWWEKRMWIEMIEEEADQTNADNNFDEVTETNDASSLGIDIQTIT